MCKPNGCIDYSMKSIMVPFYVWTLWVCVVCLRVALPAYINVGAQTYDRTRDSTQTLRAGLS